MVHQSISECIYPAMYRIRVSGRMEQDWSDRLQGMSVTTVEAEGMATYSELSGVLPDQAALMGVLNCLYNWRIPLLSMECVMALPERDDL